MADRTPPQEEADEMLERFRLVFSRLPVPLALTGPDGSVRAANGEMLDLLGVDAEALVGRSLLDLTHPDDRDDSAAAVEQVRSGDLDRVTLEKRLLPQPDDDPADQPADGPEDPVPDHVPVQVTVLRLDEGRFGFHRLVQMEPRTDPEKDELRRQAFEDPLTGLANRRALDRRVEPRLDPAVPEQPPGGHRWSLVFVDLDGFKAINDAHGHRIGDALLVSVAERLAALDSGADLVSRIGGDEFVLLLATDEPARVAEAVERVRRALAEPFAVEEHRLTITVSVGVAVPRPDDTTARLLDRADVAMYRDKRRRAES